MEKYDALRWREVAQLDEGELFKKREKRLRNWHLQKVPLFRFLGYLLLFIGVWSYQWILPSPYPLWKVILYFFGFTLLAWLTVYVVHFYWRHWTALTNVFFVLDLFLWNFAIYITGGQDSWLFFILLLRVFDQCHVEACHSVFFNHIASLSYLGLLYYMHLEGTSIQWQRELVKVFLLYLGGWYVFLVTIPVRWRHKELLRSLSEGRKVIQALTEEKKKTEVLSQTKSIFLSNVSHELRTPLTSVLGSLKILKAKAKTKLEEKEQQLLEISLRNTERLVGLVNDLLDIQKAEAGRLEFHWEIVPLAQLIEEGVESCSPYGLSKNVQLRILSTVPVQVKVDPKRFLQVLNNLLSNAIKFSPKGGQVEIESCFSPKDKSKVQIRVRDYGKGVPDEEKKRIFQVFYQVDSSSTKEYAGTGLGLTIAKNFVEAFGGKIWVEDPKEGPGAVFVVELPCVEEKTEKPKEEKHILLWQEESSEPAPPWIQTLPDTTVHIVSSLEEVEKLLQRSIPLHLVVYDLAHHSPQKLTQLGKLLHKYHRLAPLLVFEKGEESKKHSAILELWPSIEKVTKEDRELFISKLLELLKEKKEKKKILHIEDEKDIYHFLCHLVGSHFLVDWAKDTEEARKKLKESSYDLLVLDIYLPRESGIQFLRWLENSKYSHIPVVVFSVAQLDRGMRQKVFASLVKTESSNEEIVNTIWAALLKEKQSE